MMRAILLMLTESVDPSAAPHQVPSKMIWRLQYHRVQLRGGAGTINGSDTPSRRVTTGEG